MCFGVFMSMYVCEEREGGREEREGERERERERRGGGGKERWVEGRISFYF